MFYIYKVRLLDDLGKEVAEFGFYADKDEAIKRRLEVLQKVTQPNVTLEIRTIEVQGQCKVTENFRKAKEDLKSFYELKDSL